MLFTSGLIYSGQDVPRTRVWNAGTPNSSLRSDQDVKLRCTFLSTPAKENIPMGLTLKFSANLARGFSPRSLDDVTMQSRANLPRRWNPLCSPITTKHNITVAFSRGNLQDSTGHGWDENWTYTTKKLLDSQDTSTMFSRETGQATERILGPLSDSGR